MYFMAGSTVYYSLSKGVCGLRYAASRTQWGTACCSLEAAGEPLPHSNHLIGDLPSVGRGRHRIGIQSYDGDVLIILYPQRVAIVTHLYDLVPPAHPPRLAMTAQNRVN